MDLRELITARRAELELQAEKLIRQLQEVRDELEELTVAERVARRLAEQARAESEPAVTSPAGQVAGRATSKKVFPDGAWVTSANVSRWVSSFPTDACVSPSAFCLPPELPLHALTGVQCLQEPASEVVIVARSTATNSWLGLADEYLDGDLDVRRAPLAHVLPEGHDTLVPHSARIPPRGAAASGGRRRTPRRRPDRPMRRRPATRLSGPDA